MFVRILLVAKHSKKLKTCLDIIRAVGIGFSVVFSGDIIVRIGVDVSLEEKDRSTSSKGTLEPLWVLHSQPGC